MTLKVVTKDFKPKQSLTGVRERKLLDEIEELKERLEEETKRADELFDQVERFEKNNHDEYEVIAKYDYEDMKRDEGILDDLQFLQEELSIAKWRADLGIEYAKTEVENILEQLQELEA